MIFNQMLSRTIKTPNLTKTELSSIFFSLCTVAFLLCKQTNFRFCGKVDREASDCILPWADPCLSPKRDLTLSLTFSLTHSLAHLPATRSSRHTLVSREAWMATCTTRWAGRSSVTPWSSTTSIESRYQRKGWSLLKKCWFCKNNSQGRFYHGNSFARNRQVVS